MAQEGQGELPEEFAPALRGAGLLEVEDVPLRAGVVAPKRYVKMRRSEVGTGWLNEVIQISRPVDNSMYFNRPPADDVEGKVGFNNQDAVTVFSQFRMARGASQERMLLKQSNPFVELLDKRKCPS